MKDKHGEEYIPFDDLTDDDYCSECGHLLEERVDWYPYGDTEVPYTSYGCPICG